ncbi:DUF6660 family protein [Niabella aurantiaca]|uniref:DUF6660 family protein n=1 Tax=Niabella aurantiaca TaxID=379900 RepID=UPI0012FC5616|nr:DUF6660 family protein [Niabella aurantiaca]
MTDGLVLPGMKWFLFLFGCYLLSLTAIPCSDDRDAVREDLAIATLQTTGGHDHNTEHCTPLCLCSCCCTVVAAAPVPVLTQGRPLLWTPRLSSFHSDKYRIGFHSTIWQPPKKHC